MNKNHFLGIDIGSVSVKVSLLDDKFSVLYTKYKAHSGHPWITLFSLLKDIKDNTNFERLSGVAVTGSGREKLGDILRLPTVNEIVAQATYASHFYLDTKTVIEIGGQDSKYIKLAKNSHHDALLIVHQQMNDICAAGTGAFVSQQAERLGVAIEDFGDLALRSKNPAFIACRCAVFAKTDIIHLIQEGRAKEDIAAGICNAVVRNYMAQFSKGKKLEAPVLFQGGLAANKGVVRALKEILMLSDGQLKVPDHFYVTGAIGTAIQARKYKNIAETVYITDLINSLEHYLNNGNHSSERKSTLPMLNNRISRISTLLENSPVDNEDIFLGVDVGSTSTCIAVLNRGGELVGKSYTFNCGHVIDSVILALQAIQNKLKKYVKTINVKGIGVTGSGRYLVAKYLGAEIVRDEITAQAKAAAFILPDVDTVFEIGGQDSKYIRLSNGRVVDFEMNKICAAGTGSFLHEQAIRLGEDISNFSKLAYKSENPVDLGSRCTVFMESDLISHQQSGCGKNELVAGLSYSIVKNFFEKVVAGRHIGEKILFLGGTAFNESVASAFNQILGEDKEIIVPKHHEVSAAVGMALIARSEILEDKVKNSNFDLLNFDAKRNVFKVSTFKCSDCENTCSVNFIKIQESSYYYGGVCGKYENRKKNCCSMNPFKERNDLLLSYHEASVAKEGRKKIGILRTQMFYELFPLYCVFLQELGFEVIISDPTDNEITKKGLEKTSIDNCFSCKVVYGHVDNLIQKGVKKIFLPSLIEFERRVKDIERNYSCPQIQAIPRLIGLSFPSIEVISPVFVRYKSDQDWQKEMISVAKQKLGKPIYLAKKALDIAVKAQEDFKMRCEQLGEKFLSESKAEKIFVVVMGKIYNVCDHGLNLNINKKLLERDVIPIPYDCLPISKQKLPQNYIDMVWSAGQDLLRTAKIVLENPMFYPLLITNFGCGPDSFGIKYLEEMFKDKSFLVLEVDEHSSDVGIITRIEAFLNNIQKNTKTDFSQISTNFKPYLPSKQYRLFNKILYVPVGFDSYKPIAASFESIGIRTKLLPLHDEQTEKLGRLYSKGNECLPYIMHVGDALRMTKDPEFHPEKSAFFLPASDLSCRVSLFPTSMKIVLRDLGYPDIPIIAPRISMDKDEVLKVFGLKFLVNVFRGIQSVELLSRLLTEKRVYEFNRGECDKLYEDGVNKICNSLIEGNFFEALKAVVKSFDNVKLNNSRQRPVIGLVGDDYTRGNNFANNDFIRVVEGLGCEVRTVPIWSSYLVFQMGMKPLKTFRKGKYVESLSDAIKSTFGRIDMLRISKMFKGHMKCYPDPSYAEMMEFSTRYLDEKTEPLVIIALSHINHLMKHGVNGIANLIGFNCMIHSIVTANMKKLCEKNHNLPILTLLFDFQKKVHQKNRIEAFVYQVHQVMERFKTHTSA